MLIEWLIRISDYGDAAISKGIHHFGVIVGIGGGATVYVGNEVVQKGAAVKEAMLPDFIVSMLPYAGFITMTAGAVLILKHLVDMTLSVMRLYYERRDKAAEFAKNIDDKAE